MANKSFRAVPLPDGDPEWGVPGPLVSIMQYGPDGLGSAEIKRVWILDVPEAADLCVVLADALDQLGGRP